MPINDQFDSFFILAGICFPLSPLRLDCSGDRSRRRDPPHRMLRRFVCDCIHFRLKEKCSARTWPDASSLFVLCAVQTRNREKRAGGAEAGGGGRRGRRRRHSGVVVGRLCQPNFILSTFLLRSFIQFKWRFSRHISNCLCTQVSVCAELLPYRYLRYGVNNRMPVHNIRLFIHTQKRSGRGEKTVYSLSLLGVCYSNETNCSHLSQANERRIKEEKRRKTRQNLFT